MRTFELNWEISENKLYLKHSGFDYSANTLLSNGIEIPDKPFDVFSFLERGLSFTSDNEEYLDTHPIEGDSKKTPEAKKKEIEDCKFDFSVDTPTDNYSIDGSISSKSNIVYGNKPLPISKGGDHASYMEFRGISDSRIRNQSYSICRPCFIPTSYPSLNSLGNILKKNSWSDNWILDNMFVFLMEDAYKIPKNTVERMSSIIRRCKTSGDLKASSRHERDIRKIIAVKRKRTRERLEKRKEKGRCLDVECGNDFEFHGDDLETHAVTGGDDDFYLKSSILMDTLVHSEEGERVSILSTLESMTDKKLNFFYYCAQTYFFTSGLKSSGLKRIEKTSREGSMGVSSSEGGHTQSEEYASKCKRAIYRILDLLPKDDVLEDTYTLKMNAYPKTVLQKTLVQSMYTKHILNSPDIMCEVIKADSIKDSIKILTSACLNHIHADDKILDVDYVMGENLRKEVTKFKEGKLNDSCTILQRYIVDGFDIYNRYLIDKVEGLEMLDIKGNLLNQTRKSAYNHRRELLLSEKQMIKKIERSGKGFTRPYPEGPGKLPKLLDETIMLDKMHIYTSGKELGHCIGGKINDLNSWLFRKGTVCAEVGSSTGIVIQCYDSHNKITEDSKLFQKEIASSISDMTASGWFYDKKIKKDDNSKVANRQLEGGPAPVDRRPGGAIARRTVVDGIGVEGVGNYEYQDYDGLDVQIDSIFKSLEDEKIMYVKKAMFVETFNNIDSGTEIKVSEEVYYTTHDPEGGSPVTIEADIKDLAGRYDLVVDDKGKVKW